MKKRSLLFIAAAILIISAVVTAYIYEGRSRQTRECALYFLNSSGASLAVEERRISYHYEDDLPEAVLKRLVKGPENNQNSRVINRHAKVNSVYSDGEGNYTVDFTSDFYPEDNSRLVYSVYSVVKTLCSIGGINRVKVTVEGQDVVTSDGTAIGALTSDDINLSIDTYTSETHYVQLYFTDTATKNLVPEVRSVRITDQQPIEQYIINELIKGPDDENHSEVLSKDTTLISVTISDNIAFINFAKNFIDKNTSSLEREERAIFAIANSLTELENINRVQFLIEGKRVEKLGELSIEYPIGRNEEIIE